MICNVFYNRIDAHAKMNSGTKLNFNDETDVDRKQLLSQSKFQLRLIFVVMQYNFLLILSSAEQNEI